MGAAGGRRGQILTTPDAERGLADVPAGAPCGPGPLDRDHLTRDELGCGGQVDQTLPQRIAGTSLASGKCALCADDRLHPRKQHALVVAADAVDVFCVLDVSPGHGCHGAIVAHRSDWLDLLTDC